MASLVRTEAAEQPACIARVFQRADEFDQLRRDLQGRFDRVVIVARGSSDNAARYAQYLFAIRNGWSVGLATPSLVTQYGVAPNLDRTLVMAISQSGESPDILSFIERARDQDVPTVAITNEPHSPLAEVAEHTVALECGREGSVAATKSYTSTLAVLAMFSLAHDQSVDQAALADVPTAMAEVLTHEVPSACLDAWADARRGLVIGRGYEFSTAHEIAIKMQELAGVIAQAQSSADVHHGPTAGLTGSVPALVVASAGRVEGELERTTRLVADRAPVTTLGSAEAPHAHATVAWRLPRVEEWLAPLVSVTAGQQLAIALAEHVGLDPDRPVGLQKVTRTT